MDQDVTQSISYIIVRGDTGRFRLDENNGRLTTNAELDYERQRSYSLTVSTRQAANANGAQYSATVTISVVVSVWDRAKGPLSWLRGVCNMFSCEHIALVMITSMKPKNRNDNNFFRYMVAPDVVETTALGAASDDKVSIMTTL